MESIKSCSQAEAAPDDDFVDAIHRMWNNCTFTKSDKNISTSAVLKTKVKLALVLNNVDFEIFFTDFVKALIAPHLN